jgi:hypothetical protein
MLSSFLVTKPFFYKISLSSGFVYSTTINAEFQIDDFHNIYDADGLGGHE